MQLIHAARALRAVTTREIIKFVQQRGRLLSALVRPLMWLAVFAAGFQNVFGVSIIPPYKTYITYQVYIVPGLLGIILLFHGMQSSLSMVYDREMGVMRLLLTAPLPRWVLLACKLGAGTVLSVITCYVFLAVCILFDVTFDWSGWLTVLPALVHVRADARIAVAVSLGPHQAGREFRRRHELRDVPDVLLLLGALSAVEAARGRLRMALLVSMANPFTHAVEMIRFALYGMFDPVSALVVCRRDGGVLSAGGDRLRPATRHAAPRRPAGVGHAPLRYLARATVLSWPDLFRPPRLGWHDCASVSEAAGTSGVTPFGHVGDDTGARSPLRATAQSRCGSPQSPRPSGCRAGARPERPPRSGPGLRTSPTADRRARWLPRRRASPARW